MIPTPGDAVALTRLLVRVDSRNPGLVPGAPGEGDVARTLASVLEAWGFEVTLQQVVDGRPNVVARIGGGGPGGRSLMFNGHLDVVGVDGMTHPPFDAHTVEGRLFGRGATDMKGGVAAMCAAAWRAAHAGLGGEIIVAAVVDEEWQSAGTRCLIERGVRADACIVTEPTRMAIAPAHKGFTWTEVEFTGRAAHGSRYDVGIDAIRHAGLLMAELDRVERDELVRHTHPLLGHASLHVSEISGGSGWSTYPDRCTLTIERRTVPGESPDDAVREMEDALSRVSASTSTMRGVVRHVFSQWPSDVAVDAPIVAGLSAAMRGCGETVAIEGLSAWTDAALLNAAGIPAICYGPGDISLAHSATEWVAEDEITRASAVLERLARDWCGVA
jgi:acetylornithine deacetylase